jgi:hypothetical protein
MSRHCLLAPIFLSVISLAACAHTQTSAAVPRSVFVVEAPPPGCVKIGEVKGVGGGDQRAIEDALAQAAERGATHIVLGTPDLNVTDGLTTVVDGTLFDCPSAAAE